MGHPWSVLSSPATQPLADPPSLSEYLSPERARGSLHDERLSDLWAVGVTMYEVAVGRTPFEKDETEEFLTPEALKDYYKR